MRFHGHPASSFLILPLLLSSLLLDVPLLDADLSSDAHALQDFATRVLHARKLDWDSPTRVCHSWVGITCSPDGSRVTAVRLPGFGLYGPIPRNTLGKLDGLKVLSLRSNYLSGDLPDDVPSIPALQYLYLQHNNFSGGIPSSLSTRLSVLDLSHNSFSGSIPETLQSLARLTALKLEGNSISGTIPSLNLPRLKSLNLSSNNLTGSIPGSLHEFPSSSFAGNSLLCGEPLSPCSMIPNPSSTTSQEPAKALRDGNPDGNRKVRTRTIVVIAVGCSLAIFLLVVVILVCCLKKGDGIAVLKRKEVDVGNVTSKDFGSGVQEPEKNKLFFFEGCDYNFDLEDLLRASAEVLGKGSYGTAYKAILDEGTTLVVKRLREVVAGRREFDQQMETVGKAGRHPNIVPLRAYYYSKDEKLLVYEYMPHGSLFARLHDKGQGRTPLDWDSRLKVSLGVAKGIAHIHLETGARCVHGDIKSTNVFLNQENDGCVSDIGLAPLMTFSAAISRSIGYNAPEVFETRKVTQKSDVYSFGVLLLEMLTGKTPLKYAGYDDIIDLPRWVRSVVREEWTAEVFDVELLRYDNVEEEMVQMLQIALACVTRVPDARPRIDEVVKMIEEIRQPDMKDRLSSGTESNVQTP
ncbi:hypothetical protein MLD38_018834 [Melastoma candidum]|uniref:Uncharacterized protein n=1 Tax=Melastoma candidum TaxID=119954 RepID=A0ACB9QV00_9MYRT|nr:hypothetical protein MLD38_018834 [Melastoma candidum]